MLRWVATATVELAYRTAAQIATEFEVRSHSDVLLEGFQCS